MKSGAELNGQSMDVEAESQIVEAARDGDADSFAKLYECAKCGNKSCGRCPGSNNGKKCPYSGCGGTVLKEVGKVAKT